MPKIHSNKKINNLHIYFNVNIQQKIIIFQRLIKIYKKLQKNENINHWKNKIPLWTFNTYLNFQNN